MTDPYAILVSEVMQQYRVRNEELPEARRSVRPLGVTNIRTFVNPDDPKKVGVLMDIPDMDAVMAFMQGQEAADAMAYDGVQPETLVMLVDRQPL